MKLFQDKPLRGNGVALQRSEIWSSLLPFLVCASRALKAGTVLFFLATSWQRSAWRTQDGIALVLTERPHHAALVLIVVVTKNIRDSTNPVPRGTGYHGKLKYVSRDFDGCFSTSDLSHLLDEETNKCIKVRWDCTGDLVFRAN